MDGGERGSQLVAQAGQELPLDAVRAPQRGRFLPVPLQGFPFEGQPERAGAVLEENRGVVSRAGGWLPSGGQDGAVTRLQRA